MTIVSFSDLRANLAKHFDTIERDRTELIVTRQNHEPMVVMSLSDFESLKETMHLLSSPANAEHLRRSIADLEAGRGIEKTLNDLAKP
jgi:antitoxin YefM